MWPSFEREREREREMCCAGEKAASGAEVQFQQRAGGIHRSLVCFTETYEGSLSGRHTYAHIYTHVRTHAEQVDSADSREALLLSLCAKLLYRGFRVALLCTLETG